MENRYLKQFFSRHWPRDWRVVAALPAAAPVRRGCLDFIVVGHVLEHLPFPLQALQSWYAALAPGSAVSESADVYRKEVTALLLRA